MKRDKHHLRTDAKPANMMDSFSTSGNSQLYPSMITNGNFMLFTLCDGVFVALICNTAWNALTYDL